MPNLSSILVLNCGSSSIKFAIMADGTTPICHGLIDNINHADCVLKWAGDGANTALPQATYPEAMQKLLHALQQQGHLDQVSAVGHRVVHGGTVFTQATLLNNDHINALDELAVLAPLHNPANVIGIRAAQQACPQLPQVAVFDTAFHQTMPAQAFRYAVPTQWYQQHRVRRYGFHGISHQYISQAAAAELAQPANQCQIISTHLGNGGSVCAIQQGRSVDTTMGLTPLAGIVMGTRCGDLDPGVHAYLCQQLDCDINTLTEQLNRHSGLLGLSGLSHDMRQLEAAAQNGHNEAQLALDVYCYQLAKHIAAMSSALSEVHALVFTGGIGENSSHVRQAVVAHLKNLGLRLDKQKNQQPKAHQGRIHDTDSRCPILVIATQEETLIAQETRRCVENQA